MKTKLKRGVLITLAALLCLCGFVSCFSTPEKSGDGEGIVIHYYRSDKNYEGWNLWVWPSDPGEEGKGYLFGPPDAEGWVTSRVPLASFVMEYGYIVRKSTPSNAWEAKDYEDDRHSSAREIWVISRDAKTYTSKPVVN